MIWPWWWQPALWNILTTWSEPIAFAKNSVCLKTLPYGPSRSFCISQACCISSVWAIQTLSQTSRLCITGTRSKDVLGITLEHKRTLNQEAHLGTSSCKADRTCVQIPEWHLLINFTHDEVKAGILRGSVGSFETASLHRIWSVFSGPSCKRGVPSHGSRIDLTPTSDTTRGQGFSCKRHKAVNKVSQECSL